MKKKMYIQPEVQTEAVVLTSMILTGSPAGGSGAGKINTGIPTDEQW